MGKTKKIRDLVRACRLLGTGAACVLPLIYIYIYIYIYNYFFFLFNTDHFVRCATHACAPSFFLQFIILITSVVVFPNGSHQMVNKVCDLLNKSEPPVSLQKLIDNHEVTRDLVILER